MIVDSSAFIAILRAESGWTEIRQRLLSARNLRVSAGTMIELRLVVEQKDLWKELEELLDDLSIEIVAVDSRQVELAHDGFRRFGKGRHPAGLNFGDLFAYALSRAMDEPLLYVGNDFSHTDVAPA